MAKKQKGLDKLKASVKVTTKLLQLKKGDEPPKLIAYAYSQGGRILDQKAIDAKGGSVLNFTIPNVRSRIRIVVGPEIGKIDNGIKASLTELIRRGAKERFVCLEHKNCNSELTFEIIPDIWKCWLHSFCLVRGTLVKNVDTGNSVMDLPVCNARVEIYEVDPFFIWISKLSDIDIERMRKYILEPPPPVKIPPVIQKWQLLPLDGPVPIPEFNSVKPSNNLKKNRLSFQKNLSRDQSISDESQSTIFQNENILYGKARTASTSEFRNLLIEHSRLARPIYCLLFPNIVTKKLVAISTTDDCGNFQTFFFKGCNNSDLPDLYFRATQRIFIWNIAIYDPKPIQCHTYWNYKCGKEVKLITKHPLAKTCLPCPPVNAPNNWVLITAIGNHPLSQIHGTGQSLSGSTDEINIGLTDSGAPFGGFLRLRMEFDNSLREDLNIKYYRVSWWKGEMQDFNPLTDEFTPLTMECHRHYTHEIDDDLVGEVLPLGPKEVNGAAHLFEIPPALPPKGQYSYPNLLEDLTNAKFPSNAFLPGMDSDNPNDTSGKIQLKIDLFDEDGNLVDISAQNIKYRVPSSTDLSGTIETEDASIFGLIKDENQDGLKSFIMTLHIDNNRCFSEIEDPRINGLLADECGVLKYNSDSGDSVVMPFTASHPNGFARYNFRVVRGAAPNVASKSGLVGTGNSDSVTETISNLTGDCAVAGFSEILNVDAMATNGWSRLSGYDADKVRAFVLAPHEE